MPFFFYDPTFLLLLPAFALTLWAQYRVKAAFTAASRIPSASGLRGAEAARKLLDDSGLNHVTLEAAKGRLSDHYDPRTKTLRLSAEVADSRSVAALGIAAHEVGHAVQHARAYMPFRIRQSIVPAAQFGSSLAFPLFIAGFLFTAPALMDIGIFLFLGAVAFQLITLPVEFNASTRALALLQNRGYLMEAETGQARKVLRAAALTYVAALAVSLVHLLRLFLLRGMRD